jgi:hypothetical protein
MADIRPVRLQLSRRKGFDLQALSRETNGLPAVKCDRSTKWGNPFRVGQKNPCGTITKDARHSASLYLGFAPQQPRLVEAARSELQSVNLACWCGLCDLHAQTGQPLDGTRCPYCDPCHCDTLGRIANRPLVCEEVTP